MDLLMATRPSGPRSVVLCGELDVGTAGLIRDCVGPLVDEGHCVRLDMAGVTFLDCAVLGLLVALSQRARRTGGSLHVAGLPPRQRSLVRMFHLEGVLGVVPAADKPLPTAAAAGRRRAGEAVGA